MLCTPVWLEAVGILPQGGAVVQCMKKHVDHHTLRDSVAVQAAIFVRNPA